MLKNLTKRFFSIVIDIYYEQWSTVIGNLGYRTSTTFFLQMFIIPMAETPRHGDIVADTENGLQTVFVYNSENSCCFL